MADDENLEELVEQQYGLPGMDGEARCIYLVGDMGNAVVEHLATGLDMLSRAPCQEPGGNRILVRINSPGGYAATGLALHDMMKACSCPVDTEALGAVGSCAVMAYLAGERRLAHRHSCLMIHGTRASGEGSRALMASEMEGMQWYDARAVDILVEATGLPSTDWWPWVNDGRNHDVRGGEELMRLGLATELVQYR